MARRQAPKRGKKVQKKVELQVAVNTSEQPDSSSGEEEAPSEKHDDNTGSSSENEVGENFRRTELSASNRGSSLANKIKNSSKVIKNGGLVKKNQKTKQDKYLDVPRRIGNLRNNSLQSYNEFVLMKKHQEKLRKMMNK